MRGHLHIVEYFLNKTAKSMLEQLKSPDGPGRKPPEEDKKRKQEKQIRQINQAIIWEKEIDVDEQREDEGISTVFFAIRAGNIHCLEILKRYGANFNKECMSESKQMMRPIQYAVYRGNFGIYKLILEYNSDNLEEQYQSQMSQTGSTLLHLSAFKGNVQIVKDLIEHNLNPFGANKGGDTCLHIAVRRNHLEYVYELVRWCVSKGMTAAQAEIENSSERQTPFMTAVLRENFDIASILLKNNLATKGYVNADGRDCRQIAEDMNKVRAMAYLDNREIPRAVIKRDVSAEQLSGASKVRLVDKAMQSHARKGSIEPSMSNRRDDIFGNSYQ